MVKSCTTYPRDYGLYVLIMEVIFLFHGLRA